MNVAHTWQRVSTPVAPVAGDTITLSTSYQSFAMSVPIPASAFLAKRSFRVEAWGTINVTVAISIVAAVYLGNTMIASTPSSGISLAILANGAFYGNLAFDVITSGASGVLESQGNANFQTAGAVSVPVPLANMAQITGIDLTTDQLMTLRVKATSGVGAGTLQLRLLRAEATMVS